MPIDQSTAKFLELLHASGGKPLSETPIEVSRATMIAGSQLGAPPEPVASVENRVIDAPDGPVAIRIYTPHTSRPAAGYPVVLQFHGGGFVLGNLDSHESIARYYCAKAEAVVVSVDYHLAPEHRFPTQVNDAFAALSWVAQHAQELQADVTRLAVAGDSAGGNLATAICALAKTRGGPAIAAQALLYPVTDFRPGVTYPSHAEFGGGGYFISAKDMDWFRSLYFADVATDALDPRGSPIAAPDLSGLPPAVITTAGFDPLRDEGLAYADRLMAAGVPVTYRCFEGTIHACASFAGAIPAGLEMLDFAAAWLKTTLERRVVS